MARGKTLGECLTGLRAELRLSLSPAHNVQVSDTHVQMLQRAQEWLWENYSWPHLRVERFLKPQIGQRYYDPAGCKKVDQSTGLLVAAGDVKIDRIDYFTLRDGSVWQPPLTPGILTEHFNLWDSDAGERAWPIMRWQIAEGDNVELWPVPNQDGDETTFENMLKFVGTRNLATFTEDTDTADLDDQAIILFAAADLASDPKVSQKKMLKAQQRLRDVRGNVNPRNRVRLFGKPHHSRVLRGPPTVYYRTTP